MPGVNSNQLIRTSARAVLLRQILKLNFRFWANKTSINLAQIRKREYLLGRLAPRIPGKVTQVHRALKHADLYYLRAPDVSEQRAILYFNGGGYVAGSPMGSHRDYVWRVGEACGAVIAALKYRKAPDNPYPAALTDAFEAYITVRKELPNASLTIMGDSAGGGLALALVHKLRDENLSLPSSIVVFSPWTDLVNTGQSVMENAATEHMVPTQLLDKIAALYVANADPELPYISPLYGDYVGFPPTLIFASDSEALRDDALRLAEKMRDAGCCVDFQLWHNLPHIWPIFAGMLPEARAALRATAGFLEGHWDQRSSGN